MDKIQMELFEQLTGLHEIPAGAYNIRANSKKDSRNTTANIDIVTKEDKPGIDIIIKPGTKNESVHIPVLLSKSGLQDMVYNDFYIADGADVTIVAGCGIHNSGCNESRHDGIHTFHVGKNANVCYQEKHYGEGNGTGGRVLNPVTNIYIGENSVFTLDTAQIKGVDEHPTNPYWGPAKALIDWTSEKTDKDIIIGNTTDLSGKFRFSNFGGSNPGASDLDVDNLINGMETVATTKEGGFEVNKTVVKQLDKVENEDGTLTYTITLNDGLLFSDGTPVTAKNYLYYTMVFSTLVASEAEGKDRQAGLTIVGFEEFNAYDGTNEGDGVSKTFTGLRLLADNQFSVTVKPEYANYYYAISYAGFSPFVKELWCGDFDIADDGEGCYFTDGFYNKTGDSFDMAAHLVASSNNTDTTYACSGPYVVESYDEGDKSAILTLNPNFPGNYEGAKPTIAKVIYKKVVSATQLDDLKSGGVDVLMGITGGAETDEAVAACDNSNGAFVYTHYSRAGYGKLQFRNDYGPAQFTAVRQAITYCLDRASFAKTFTGGYGGVVDGAYYAGSWMYKEAAANGMLLNAYDTSADTAIAVLEADGWIYDANGEPYVEGVRYKKIPAEYADENDKTYKSIDGAYVTTKVGDDYYMPLVLNWYGTTDNPFSDLLVTDFEQGANIAAAGIVIQKTTGDFNPMLDEFYQQAVYGFYSGTPMYSCFNYATGFTSAAYDYSYNWSIDPSFYENNSVAYLMDEADIYWLS